MAQQRAWRFEQVLACIPIEMEAKIETKTVNGLGEAPSLPGEEVNLTHQVGTWEYQVGTGVPTSLQELQKEPPTQVDLKPPWVALGITHQEWKPITTPTPRTRAQR